jgi:predicted Rossmann fold nucleotide-binding protein DprA/Smf involved in DNA uptake
VTGVQTCALPISRGSGSLDTAKRAAKQKRRVFAVRGGGAGTDELLDAGAFALDADSIDFEMLAQELEGEASEAQPQLF